MLYIARSRMKQQHDPRNAPVREVIEVDRWYVGAPRSSSAPPIMFGAMRYGPLLHACQLGKLIFTNTVTPI